MVPHRGVRENRRKCHQGKCIFMDNIRQQQWSGKQCLGNVVEGAILYGIPSASVNLFLPGLRSVPMIRTWLWNSFLFYRQRDNSRKKTLQQSQVFSLVQKGKWLLRKRPACRHLQDVNQGQGRHWSDLSAGLMHWYCVSIVNRFIKLSLLRSQTSHGPR